MHQKTRPVSLYLKHRYKPSESRASVLKETESAPKTNVKLRSKTNLPNCSNEQSNKRVTFDFTTWKPKHLNLTENKRSSTGILKKVKNKTQRFSYFKEIVQVVVKHGYFPFNFFQLVICFNF